MFRLCIIMSTWMVQDSLWLYLQHLQKKFVIRCPSSHLHHPCKCLPRQSTHNWLKSQETGWWGFNGKYIRYEWNIYYAIKYKFHFKCPSIEFLREKRIPHEKTIVPIKISFYSVFVFAIPKSSTGHVFCKRILFHGKCRKEFAHHVKWEVRTLRKK